MNNPLYVPYQTEGQKPNQATQHHHLHHPTPVPQVGSRNRLAVTEGPVPLENPVRQLPFQNKAESDANDGRSNVDSPRAHCYALHQTSGAWVIHPLVHRRTLRRIEIGSPHAGAGRRSWRAHLLLRYRDHRIAERGEQRVWSRGSPGINTVHQQFYNFSQHGDLKPCWHCEF